MQLPADWGAPLATHAPLIKQPDVTLGWQTPPASQVFVVHVKPSLVQGDPAVTGDHSLLFLALSQTLQLPANCAVPLAKHAPSMKQPDVTVGMHSPLLSQAFVVQLSVSVLQLDPVSFGLQVVRAVDLQTSHGFLGLVAPTA